MSDFDARIREAKAAGVNTLIGLNEPDSAAYSIYGLRTALLASKPFGQPIDPARIRRIGVEPYLLSWGIEHEFHGQGNYLQWAQDAATIRAADPAHLVGDLVMILAGYPSEATNPYTTMAWPLPELTISEFGPAGAVTRILDELRYAQRMWDAGARFVRGASLTVVSEFASYIGGGTPYVPSRAEILRAFVLMVAFNVRMYDVLWGATQNIDVPPGNVEGLRPVIDRAWVDTLDVLMLLNGPLREVIMDLAQFVQITATPTLLPPSQATGWVYKGLYAARKAVGGTVYIAAVNTQSEGITVSIPTTGASATDLLTNQVKTVSGGVIQDTIEANTARLYVMD